MEAIQLGNTVEEQLRHKIKRLSIGPWSEQFTSGDLLSKWLSNFDNDEYVPVLYLLSNFMYFDNSCIRELLHRAYEDLYRRPQIFSIRRNHNNITDMGIINKEFKQILRSTRFIGIGNPSESSSHLLYYYRQENNLDTKLFINAHEIYNHTIDSSCRINTSIVLKDVKRIVFIEDFCGSGNQAEEYYHKFVEIIKSQLPDIVIELHILFATDYGYERISKLGYDDVKVIYTLNSSYKCFHENSRFFPSLYKNEDGVDLIDKMACINICKKYGLHLTPDNPFGYNDGQLLISFHHNTPNNTLPIFWYSKNWNPIFKRYTKNY